LWQHEFDRNGMAPEALLVIVNRRRLKEERQGKN